MLVLVLGTSAAVVVSRNNVSVDDIDIQNTSCPICDLSQRWLDLSKKVSKSWEQCGWRAPNRGAEKILKSNYIFHAVINV